MHRLVLGVLAAKGDESAKAVLQGREEMEKGNGVYTTRVESQGMTYQLITTSKQIHLKLGLMNYRIQLAFCTFLAKHLDGKDAGTALVEKDSDRGGLYVTLTSKKDGWCVFHLSPIN